MQLRTLAVAVQNFKTIKVIYTWSSELKVKGSNDFKNNLLFQMVYGLLKIKISSLHYNVSTSPFIIKTFYAQKIVCVAFQILNKHTTVVIKKMTFLCTLTSLLIGITWENWMDNAQHRALSGTFYLGFPKGTQG